MSRLGPPDIRPVRAIHNSGQQTAVMTLPCQLSNCLRIKRLGFLLKRQHSKYHLSIIQGSYVVVNRGFFLASDSNLLSIRETPCDQIQTVVVHTCKISCSCRLELQFHGLEKEQLASVKSKPNRDIFGRKGNSLFKASHSHRASELLELIIAPFLLRFYLSAKQLKRPRIIALSSISHFDGRSSVVSFYRIQVTPD